MKENWDEVPEEIKSAFDRLGYSRSGKTLQFGVGAQYDSEVILQYSRRSWYKVLLHNWYRNKAQHEHEEIVKILMIY